MSDAAGISMPKYKHFWHVLEKRFWGVWHYVYLAINGWWLKGCTIYFSTDKPFNNLENIE